MRRLFLRLARDEQGQDLIEYALLAASVGLAGAAAWPAIRTALFTVYGSLGTTTWNLWEPPAPGGGS